MADGQTALVRSPIQTGGAVGAFVPNSFDDAWRIAGALAQSGITPFKDQNQVLAVMMAGAEVGLTPFASTQSFAMINGRATMWGDGMLAVVRAAGVKVSEWTTGSIEAGDFTARCKIVRQNGEEIEREFSMNDAKTAKLWGKRGRDGQDTPWITYPKRMICMRARSWALRDGCADILRGIKMAEEVQDYEATEAHIVGEYDQRPTDERVGGVIGGKPARDAFDDLALRMTESEDAAALEEVWSEAENANLSSNRMFALSEHYEACKEAHENGKPTPAAPTFSEPPPPSPFEALKEAGAKVSDLETYKAWSAQLKADLPRCTDEERAELKALHTPIAAKFLPPKESAGAGGRTDKDAGREAAESSSGAEPGGEAPPASESAFEVLKQECLDCLNAKAPRRALNDWAKKRDAAALTDAERADLEKIEANVREGLTK